MKISWEKYIISEESDNGALGVSLRLSDKTPNVFLRYVILNQAVNFFAAKVKELDEEHFYNRLNGEVTYVLSDTMKGLANRLYEQVLVDGYPQFVKEREKLKKKLEEANPHWWRQQPALPNTSSLVKLCEVDEIYILGGLTLEEAVQGYKAAKEELKLIENSQLDEFCVDRKKMLNLEYAGEYNSCMEELSKSHSIPDKNVFIESLNLPKIPYQKTRLSFDRRPAESYVGLDAYVTKFINMFMSKIEH